MVIHKSPIEDYDFKICHKKTENNINMKVIHLHNNNYNYNNEIRSYIESNIRFFLVEFYVEDEKYKINLKTNEYNYYLVDNRFSKDFFLFYLKYHLNVEPSALLDPNTKYTIKMVDNNVDTVEFNFTEKNESIILLKNSYKIDGK
jgi:hypothetical protein